MDRRLKHTAGAMSPSPRGYIYIRTHPAYDSYNACKLGKATNIPDRDSQYATGEIIRGKFEAVFEVPTERLGIIERLLQNEFREHNIKHDAGTEFYDKAIIQLVVPYFKQIGITYRRLPGYEIAELLRKQRIRKILKKIRISSLIRALKRRNGSIHYIPRSDQTEIINKTVQHLTENNKGLLILTCGIGKTLISLWVAQRLQQKRIIIGVPNTQLLNQWANVVSRLYDDIPLLVVSGGVTVEDITKFISVNNERCIVITTYSSAHKVYSATQETQVIFDMKINDECHHLTTDNIHLAQTTKAFIWMLEIPAVKQLSLTATIKQLNNYVVTSDDDGSGDSRRVIVSNDDIAHFGEIIERRCVLWAIQRGIICDYTIQSIIANEEQLEAHLTHFDITDETDKRIFLSAFAALKSIQDGHSHNMLIYSNNKPNSAKIIKYIQMLIEEEYFVIPGLYSSEYHSEMKPREQDVILEQFGRSAKGIISCVYCLGEGWDFPLLDAVVFAENMSSNIRIVQSALRPCRKNPNEPNKIVKIILPILNRDDWLSNNENPDMRKSREIIYQMGLEDETISQKIKVFRIEIKKSQRKPKPHDDNDDNNDNNVNNDIGEYDDELTQQLRLKTVKRAALGTSYERAKRIIAENEIKTREQYYELCDRDNRLTSEPETTYNGQFTNWVDYLGIERNYYDTDTCKIKVGECLSKHPELRTNGLDLANLCAELCLLDPIFPPNGLWTDYYNIRELSEIIVIPKKRKANIAL
jgi:superfamily II DNA or RNA helicase